MRQVVSQTQALDFINAPINPTSPRLFTVISTFAGCGGSSLGYKWAGGKVLAAVEWDANAVATYRLNHQGTPVLHRDITTVTADELLTLTGLRTGELDILDGSPPCQGFSTAGKRQIDDPRNSLFREYVRLLRGLQPRCFIMENVSGMVKGHMKHVFAICMRELKASGYAVKCQLMDAAYFGVPQHRQRVIFIGVRDDLDIEPSHPAPSATAPTVRQAWVGLPDEHGDALRGPAALIAPHVPQGDGNGGGKYSMPLRGTKAGFGFQRLAWNKPACTIPKLSLLSSSPIVHPTRNERITIRQAARLASFPDAFQFTGSFNEQWARIGNAVMPRFMQAIAEHVCEHILAPASQRASEEATRDGTA